MTQRLSLLCLALAALFTTGCLFSKKSSKSKENASIPGSVEESFKVRWLEKRTAELVAQGKAPDVARTQAADEFRERYAFTGAEQKK